MEVRFEDLCVSATATPAGRVLPSIFNSYRNFVEVRLLPSSKSWHLLPSLVISDVQDCNSLLAHLVAVVHSSLMESDGVISNLAA